MKYKGIETSFPLLISYEILAREYRRKNSPKTYSDELKAMGGMFTDTPSMNYENYGFSFSLLTINASIVEGTMRSILSEIVSNEVEAQIIKGESEGRSLKSPPELLLAKFQNEIEAQGGWERLKEQYSTYLNIDIDKSISPETKDAISTLFVLRNIIAHGTAIIHPVEKIPDAMKDVYPFKWQSKLQGARVYLEKTFNHKDIFMGLAEFGMPGHFLEKTKIFFREIIPHIGVAPERASKTIEAIDKFSFGYCNITR